MSVCKSRRPWFGLALTIIACQASKSSSADKYGDVSAVSSRGHQSAGVPVTKASPDLRRRADSLGALDPSREAMAAIRRGDLRYLAVCRLTCVPIGIPPDTVCLLQRCVSAAPAEVRAIEETNLPLMNADVIRLDSIAARYGARYNRWIHEYRRRRPASRPAT